MDGKRLCIGSIIHGRYIDTPEGTMESVWLPEAGGAWRNNRLTAYKREPLCLYLYTRHSLLLLCRDI